MPRTPLPKGFSEVSEGAFSPDPSVQQYRKTPLPEGFSEVDEQPSSPTAGDYGRLGLVTVANAGIGAVKGISNLGAVLGIPGAEEYSKELSQTQQQGEALLNPQLSQQSQIINDQGLNVNPLSVARTAAEGAGQVLPYLLTGGSSLAVGGVSALQTASDVYQSTYEQAIAAGMKPDEARALALKTAAVGGVVGGVAGKYGAEMAERAAAPYTGKIARSVAGAAGFTPAIAAQTAITTAAQDIAQGKPVDYADIAKQTAAASIGGLATGAALGAVMPAGEAKPKTPEDELATFVPPEGSVAEAPTAPLTPRQQKLKDVQDLRGAVGPGPAMDSLNAREKFLQQGIVLSDQIKKVEGLIAGEKDPNKAAELRKVQQNLQIEMDKHNETEANYQHGIPPEPPASEPPAPPPTPFEQKQILPEGAMVGGSNEGISQLEEQALEARQKKQDALDRMKAGREAKANTAKGIAEVSSPGLTEAPPGTEAQNTKLEDLGNAEFSKTAGVSTLTPMSEKDIRAETDRLTGSWSLKPDVHIFDGNKNAPPKVQKQMADEGINHEVNGFRLWRKNADGTYTPEVWINRQTTHSNAAVERVFNHEGVGHAAMELYAGGHIHKIFDGVYKTHINEIEANRYKKDRPEYGIDTSTAKGQRRAAAEFIAQMAEKNPKSTIIDRVVGQVRVALRKMGLAKQYTKNDIITQYLEPARRYMETGIPDRPIQGGVFGKGTAKFSTNKELFAVRKQIQQELNYSDPHDENRVNELNKHLEEIDDEIHQNNVAAMKQMVKSKKPLADYKDEAKFSAGKVDDEEIRTLYNKSDRTPQEESRLHELMDRRALEDAINQQKTPDDMGAKFSAGVPETEENRMQVLKTKTNSAIDKVNEIKDFGRRLFNPVGMGEGDNRLAGEQAAQKLTEEGGRNARLNSVLRKRLEMTIKDYNKRTDAQNKQFLINDSTGTRQGSVLDQKTSAVLQQELKANQDLLNKAYPDGVKNYITDMLPNIFKDQGEARKWLSRFARQNEIDGTPDRVPTMKEAMDAGHEPITMNPVEIAIYRIGEMNRAIVGRNWLSKMHEMGRAVLFSSNEQIPMNMDKLNPIFAKMLKPEEVGKESGTWYVPKEVGNIVDNYLSSGMRSKIPGFNEYMHVANFLNQAQLGFSAFHAAFTTQDVMTSKLSLAIQNLSYGEFGDAIKKITEIPFSWWTNRELGKKLIQQWENPGAHPELEHLIKAAERGGARKEDVKLYQTKGWEKMKDAWSQGKVIRGTLRIAPGVIDLFAKPIMEHLVPYQKFGVFADMAMRSMKRSAKLNETNDQLTARLQKDWASCDNRLGQLVYDNLYWDKTAKDIAQAMTRSVGWNVGTLREVGGGLIDFGKFVTGKDKELSNKTAYVLAMVTLSGIIGGTMTKWMSGDNPETLEDLYYPKTGQKDLNGNDLRLSEPSYVKDIGAYKHDFFGTLANKVNPLLTSVHDIISNKDFYGREIRHPGDDDINQALQLATYAGKQFLPLGVRNYLQVQKTSDTGLIKAGSFLGFPKAPNWVSQTKATNLASELLKDQMSQAAKSGKEFDRYQLANQIQAGLNSTDPVTQDKARTLMQDSLAKGAILPTDVSRIQKKLGTRDQLSYYIQKLNSVDAAMRVWRTSSPVEKQKIAYILSTKIANSKTIDNEDRQKFLQEVQQGMRNAEQ